MDRDFNLQVRMSQSEKESIERATHIAGLTVWAWVRDNGRAVREELQSSGVNVPFLETQGALR